MSDHDTDSEDWDMETDESYTSTCTSDDDFIDDEEAEGYDLYTAETDEEYVPSDQEDEPLPLIEDEFEEGSEPDIF